MFQNRENIWNLEIISLALSQSMNLKNVIAWEDFFLCRYFDYSIEKVLGKLKHREQFLNIWGE